jgi:hypothetical protein
VISLIQHGDLDGIEVQQALTFEVFKAPWGRHDDVNPVAKSLDLSVLGHTAKDGGHAEVSLRGPGAPSPR